MVLMLAGILLIGSAALLRLLPGRPTPRSLEEQHIKVTNPFLVALIVVGVVLLIAGIVRWAATS